MLDHYFVRPGTVNQIRSSWIGPLIEQYLTALHERGYAVSRRSSMAIYHPKL